MDNFDLKKFLVENRLTKNSQQLTNEVDGGTGPVKDLKSLKFPNGKEYRLGEPDPNDDGIVVQIQKYPNGYFITVVYIATRMTTMMIQSFQKQKKPTGML